MSDADMKDESGVAGTQEAMLDLHKTTLPEGGMIWDPISKSYVTRDGKPQPLQTQVPGTPDPGSIDFQEKTKNPLFEGVFARTADFIESQNPGGTAESYRETAQWFYDKADQSPNSTIAKHLRAKGDYYMNLAGQYNYDTDGAAIQAGNPTPDSSSATDVYQDRTDKPTINNTDNSFPSMISATTPEVTSTMLNTGKNSWSADDAHRSALGDSPTLANCPNDCGGMMSDHDGESVCHDCGHKEKIHYADKQAGLLDVAGPAAGMGMAMDVVAPEVGIPLQAASLMGKIMGGGKGNPVAGAETPTAGEGSSVATDTMRQSSSVEDGDWGTNGNENSGHDSEPDSGNKGSEAQDSAADELSSDVDTGTGGQDSLHGLDPNLVFEVFGPHLESIADNDDSHEDPIAKAVHEVFMKIDPEYLSKAAAYHFNKIAGGKCPTCAIELDGTMQCGIPNPSVPCPVGLAKAGGSATMPVLPGNSIQSPSTMGQPVSHVGSDEDGFEITSGRRPKMCPAHDALVTYALTLGDPAAAVQALSGELFGPNCCSGGHELFNKNDQPTKCRYKPEMIKQQYWDDKDALAEERKLQREEQQALLQQAQPMADATHLTEEDARNAAPEPEGQLIGGPEYDALMEQQQVEEKLPTTQDIPDVSGLSIDEDYIPREQGETTFPAEWDQQVADIPVHAKIKWSGTPGAMLDAPAPEQMFQDNPPEELINDDPAGLISEGVLDSDGNPLKVGAKYEVHSPNNTDFIPDVYEITGEDSNLIQFRVQSDVEGGDPFSFDDSLPVQQIKAEGLTFVPAGGDPNASGDVAPSDDDNTKGYDDPTGQTDLDTGGNSKASKTAINNENGFETPDSDKWDMENPAPGTGLSQHGEPSRSDPREYEQPVDLQSLIDQVVNLTPEEKELLVQALQPGLAPDEEVDEFGAPTAFDKGATEPYTGQDINEQPMHEGRVLEGKPEFDWLNEESDQGVHTAGRDFSLGEQRSFVNESGEARNLDKLDLSGTHYPESGINDPFDDSALFM